MDPRIEVGNALFLDFDGTLAEIAHGPASVRVSPRVPMLLNDYFARLGGAVAVISGRQLNEMARLLDPYTGAIAGIHGLERRNPDGRMFLPDPLPFLHHARRTLTDFVNKTPGVELEDKRLGVALHFRSNPEQGFACLRLAREIAWLSGQRLAVTQGTMVVDLHPAGANKGRAILDFLSEPPFRGRRPVYVGDDRPDESGFVFVNHLGGTTIRIGTGGRSSAQFRLPGVAAVIDWMARSRPDPQSIGRHSRIL